MTKGFCIQDGNPRKLTYEGSVVAVGGSSREGLHANGKDLVFDGSVIAHSTYIPNIGIGIKNNGSYGAEVCYGDDVLRIYPPGLTTVGNVSPNAWYYYPYGWFPDDAEDERSYGAKQGAAIYGGLWYQFYHGGYVSVWDLVRNRQVTSFFIPMELWPLPEEQIFHCSSAQFSNEFVNPNDKLPLVYITTSGKITDRGYTCVINLNTNSISLVRWFCINTEPGDVSVSAFDFDNGIGYAVGYPQGVSDHKNGGKFEVVPFTFPQNGSGDVTSQVIVNLQSKVVLDRDVNVTYINTSEELQDNDWSNLQDADFKDGHLYILYGGTPSRTDRPKIIDYIPMSDHANAMHTMYSQTGDGNPAEGEGMAAWKNGWVLSGLYGAEQIFVL